MVGIPFVLLLVLLFWHLSNFFTLKYNVFDHSLPFSWIVIPFLKGSFIFVFFIFVLSIQFYHRTDYLKAIWLFTAIVFTIDMFYYFLTWFFPAINILKRKKKAPEVVFVDQYPLEFDVSKTNNGKDRLIELILKQGTDENSPIVGLIKRNLLDGRGVSNGKMLVINGLEKSALPSGVRSDFAISTKRLNEMVELNHYLRFLYDSIQAGGYLVINYTPFESDEAFRKAESNVFYRYLIYPFYFMFYRAIPKIPIVDKFHLFITRVKNSVFSRSEIWGRLHYSGFNVIDETCQDQLCYVLAQKAFSPSQNKNPSYYPIIKLRRVGLNGSILHIYKLRTMHPYSEYIQKKVFDTNQLSNIGKFNNDFRITGWGKFLRKYYIDEFPQFVNWLRGEVKTVGIRAMSEHYFSLYPNCYQQLYHKVKPGILSPLPENKIDSFDDVVKLEQPYLERYVENPIKTDIVYFFKIVYQLFIKGQRSS